MADGAARNDLKTDPEDECFPPVSKSADNIVGFLTWRLEDNKPTSWNYAPFLHQTFGRKQVRETRRRCFDVSDECQDCVFDAL